MLPAQEWSVEDRTYLTNLKLNQREVPIRSLLCYYDWKTPDAHRKINAKVNKANPNASIHKENIARRCPDLATGPRALRGFTRISPLSSTQRETKAVTTQFLPSSPDSVHFARLQDIVSPKDDGDDEQDEEMVYYGSDDDCDCEVRKIPFCAQKLEKERYMNVLGPTAEDGESIATCIVELLGPHSKAGEFLEVTPA